MTNGTTSGGGDPPAAVRVERVAPGVMQLMLSNPGKRNALDIPMLDALARHLREADADRSLRCLLLTGDGDMFSSGYDIGGTREETFIEDAERLVAHPTSVALAALDDCELPVVAAINGPAIGGGLELALGCDLRIASQEAEFGMPPGRLGLVYSHTGLRRFVDVIGSARTRELFLLGGRIDGPTAERWGLVNRLVPPDRLAVNALECCQRLAANAPNSIRGNKRILRRLLDAEGAVDRPIEEELLALRAASFGSPEFREGVHAFREKREPIWSVPSPDTSQR